MSVLRKMQEGQPFDATGAEVAALRDRCTAAMRQIEGHAHDDPVRAQVLRGLLGGFPDTAMILTGMFVEYGCNLYLGDFSFVNINATFLDAAPIRIGDHAMIGPNVQMITISHPLRPEDRRPPMPGRMPPFQVVTTAQPITVGEQSWIGAGAILLPGATVGARAMIGAGAVGTGTVPEGMVAVGNPARVIRSVDDDA